MFLCYVLSSCPFIKIFSFYFDILMPWNFVIYHVLAVMRIPTQALKMEIQMQSWMVQLRGSDRATSRRMKSPPWPQSAIFYHNRGFWGIIRTAWYEKNSYNTNSSIFLIIVAKTPRIGRNSSSSGASFWNLSKLFRHMCTKLLKNVRLGYNFTWA